MCANKIQVCHLIDTFPFVCTWCLNEGFIKLRFIFCRNEVSLQSRAVCFNLSVFLFSVDCNTCVLLEGSLVAKRLLTEYWYNILSTEFTTFLYFRSESPKKKKKDKKHKRNR